MPDSPKPPTPRIVRMAHPLSFVAYLRHVGARANPFLEKARLPVDSDDGSAFVPLTDAWGFFAAASRSVEPSLGWHVGRFAGDHHLNRGLLSKLKHAPTLYKALQDFIRLVRSEASHLQLGLFERENSVLLFTHYPGMKAVSGYADSQAYQLGVFVTIARHYAGSQWIPTEIGIEHPVVPSAAKKLYPGTRILPRQRKGYLAIPRSILHLPPPKGATVIRGADEPIVMTNELSYAETLSELLRPHLSKGYPDTNLAAALMDTSVRTLARRLADEGRSYRDLIDNLRFTEARKLLDSPGIRVVDVAASIGFDDSSHFARMFRRIGGLSPCEYREEVD